MRNEGEGDTAASDLLVPRGSERRGADVRRTTGERRFGERRDPVRAAAGRRVLFPFDRRIAERRTLERRESWPEPGV
ncbi:MAG TPA: hypothetical protein VIP57_17880 [Candidatus Dormibacteraeota bacterium]|jgi:hypothetical protein